MKQALIFFSAWVLVSCGNQTDEPSKELPEKKEKASCTYKYNNEVKVNWTAFKLSEKVGVMGTFDSVVVSKTNVAETLEEALIGAEFSIYTSTVNSKDSLRDWKIANHFFGTMNETDAITGNIKSLENGKGEVVLMMNGISVNTPINYFSTADRLELMLETTINISDWSQPALDKLNQECSEKHTGEDGINKLWPDVEVRVFVGFDKNCK